MVNTYYTRAQSRLKAAPRSRGAKKNLAAGLRRERAVEREDANWLCVGCEEAGQILPGHFQCSFG